jgi:RHS repeat-associated protein
MVTTRKKTKIPPAVTVQGEKQARYTEATISSVFGARYLDARTSRWISADPALGEYVPAAPLGDAERKHNQNLPGMGGVFNVVNLHVYHYAANNPVKYVDPDGRDIEVIANENGTYTITGGTQNNDKNIYIMNNGQWTGEVLGQTFTEHSFFNEEGNVVEGAIIDPNDHSGQAFIDGMIANTPGLRSYMDNAKNRMPYDFKAQGVNEHNDKNYQRGMPIKDANGNTVYASARDVGNYVAGYVAGWNGLPWGIARIGFDRYQGTTEGNPTQAAQRLGHDAGSRQFIHGIIRNMPRL